MDFATEAAEIRALGRIWKTGLLYRGLKPVNWCIDCGSALAEAEVEYEDKTSSAIDVAFEAVDAVAVARAFGSLPAPAKVRAVIWTTTPWTLPGNQAIAAHPTHEYELVGTEKGALILVSELREASLMRLGLAGTTLGRAAGSSLEKLMFRHPFENRAVPLVLGEHVTLDAGTGLVHTAPAHGAEDFDTGVRYGLPLDQPVDDQGRFKPTVPHFAGLSVREAEKPILDRLASNGALLKNEPLRHSYPHCWRHKTPIIFRATTQWFVGMDRAGTAGGPTLRERAKKAIEDTTFYPAWGRSRIEAMVAGRPDWTLSRQRNWGVPLPFFLDRDSDELHPETERLLEEAAARVEMGGIEAWFGATCEDFGVDPAKYRKITDTVDVWFDSGTTHFTVLRGLAGQKWPADLYLEGSDQHRGWFQSSLLTGCAMEGRAPYDALLTHGFVVDGQGRKQSKSLGNVIAPQKVSDTLGAEIIRLWVASADYSGELYISDEILKRVVEGYRRIRNTLRFLLANTADFDPVKDLLPPEAWVEIDRYALAMTREMLEGAEADYARFEFHLVSQRLQTFCSEELGAFWLDILKDRLYTTGRDSRARRSAQSALHHVTQALLRLMAPILSFTAEEAWEVLHPGREESVFFHTWKDVLPAQDGERALVAKWRRLREIRGTVQRELEELRKDGAIGSSLAAEVEIASPEGDRLLLESLGEDLRFLLITSTARVETGEALAVRVTPSESAKCDRCWHYREEVGADPRHKTLCGRCIGNIEGPGETRRHA
jgi:isoleucyl-tRNA synthetase